MSGKMSMRVFLSVCFIMMFAVTIAPLHVNANVSVLQAKPGVHAYEQVRSHFGNGSIEVPDCSHFCTLDAGQNHLDSCDDFDSYRTYYDPSHPMYPKYWWLAKVEHITVEYDQTLGDYVFLFHSHYDSDHDCVMGRSDRLRTEIHAAHNAPEHAQGRYGDSVNYRWQFKLDNSFAAGNRFTHVFQVKARGGSKSSPPILTLTPRGTRSRMEIMYGEADDDGNGVYERVHWERLDKFLGEWLEADFRASYTYDGNASLTIRRVSDGEELLSWQSGNGNVQMWRDGASSNRGKWGIYRSSEHREEFGLKDEVVRFNNICVAKDPGSCEPDDEDGGDDDDEDDAPPVRPDCPFYDPVTGRWFMCL